MFSLGIVVIHSTILQSDSSGPVKQFSTCKLLPCSVIMRSSVWPSLWVGVLTYCISPNASKVSLKMVPSSLLVLSIWILKLAAMMILLYLSMSGRHVVNSSMNGYWLWNSLGSSVDDS